MKKIVLLLLATSLFSCKQEEKKESLYTTPAADEGAEAAGISQDPSVSLGREIFNGKGNCFSCHKPEQKFAAPSIKQIAKIYKDKNGDMVQFLKGKGEPIVDPSQYEVMKTNFYITRNFSEKELKALEDYMYSHLDKQ
ncbi:c-type cytochrome [Flavobacterium alkalisoli]|uniref:C-type cytochrome n=1 Tax=Flavobacterium alkalisoli TaxID=2602769 RepID=A0A5B9FRI7_9FLAO|nr:c-type cytochrome [Flavobacterium alkalisoli]QEE48696.1 c-type cytochrome [Flavobacterium alkalisoli]